VTSRERVIAALRHQETDRIPIDLGGMRSTGITAIAYNRLKRHLGIPIPDDPQATNHTRVYDIVQQLAEPDAEVLDRFGADVVDLSRAFLSRPEDWQPWELPDGTPAQIPAWFEPQPDGEGGWLVEADDGTVIARMPVGVQYFHQAHQPLRGAVQPSAFDDLPSATSKVTWWALPCAPGHRPLSDPEHFAHVRERAQWLYENTDRAIMAAFGGNILEAGQFLRGFDVFLEDLAARPTIAEALMDKLTQNYLDAIPRFFAAVGDFVQIVQLGDDLGTQLAAQISPRMYRQFIKPRHKIIYDAVREHFGGFLFLHSCGAIGELIPDLLDEGVQIINPVQTSCPGMEPERLKREFGRDLAFWGGGCETQGVLRYGTPQQVREQVRERLRIFGDGGGYVFCQVHNIMADVPPENVVAMYEAVHESAN